MSSVKNPIVASINKRRAAKARNAIKPYMPKGSTEREDRLDAIVDLIADLLHLADNEWVRCPASTITDRTTRLSIQHWKIEREL